MSCLIFLSCATASTGYAGLALLVMNVASLLVLSRNSYHCFCLGLPQFVLYYIQVVCRRISEVDSSLFVPNLLGPLPWAGVLPVIVLHVVRPKYGVHEIVPDSDVT